MPSLRKMLGRERQHLQAADVGSRFQSIYDTSVWGNAAEGVPASGVGSTLTATTELRQTLPPLLNQLGAKVVLDVGCGDFFWMRHVDLVQNYIGVDIVPSVIEKNKSDFERLNRKFICINAIEDDVPDADVVLIREVLFHLSFKDAHDLLSNILTKPRAYLIMTSDRETLFNSDIATGDFRPLNLEKAPFRLPPPIHLIEDSRVDSGRFMGVWDVSRLNA